MKALKYFDDKWVPKSLRYPGGAENTIFMSGGEFIGEHIYVGPNTQLIGGSGINLSDDVFIIGNAVLDATDGPITIGAGTKIEPFTYIKGPAQIWRDCVIRAKCSFRNSTCGGGCDLMGEIENCELGDRISTQPSCIMFNSSCGNDCNLGAHINRTSMGHRVKAKYGNINLLDATIGNDVNIGAGATTFNFDGKGKKQIFIGDGTFIGGNVAIIAADPRTIGGNVFIVAGLTVRQDIPHDTYVDPTGKHRPNRFKNNGAGHWVEKEKV